MKSFVLINFKAFQETAGKKALAMAKEIASVKKSKYEIAIAPSLLTLKEIAEKVNIPVFSQHADNVSFGAHTGSIPVDELASLGVYGTILNHSERKISMNILKETIKSCRKKKLAVVVCASKISEIERVAWLCPDFIAYEPEKLVGGNISVTEAKPEIIVEAVELVRRKCPKSRLLCGAGIHSKEDLGHALLLGAQGVLMGHAVFKSRNPAKFLAEMLID